MSDKSSDLMLNISPLHSRLCLMIAGSGVAMAAFMLFVFWVHFERYWLCLLVPFAVLAAGMSGSRMRGCVLCTSWLLLLCLGAVSWALVHDYYAWNKARWKALAELEREGITHRQIDGGYEYNAWRWTAYDLDLGKVIRPNGLPERSRNLWWVVDDEYCLAFEDLSQPGRTGAPPGEYTRLTTECWFSWAICTERSLYVLRRNGAAK